LISTALPRQPRQCAAALRQNIVTVFSLSCKRSGNVRRIMPSQRDFDRRNDARLLTPLLVMALVIAAGVLYYALTSHALAAV
jgi:hypothetical protein